jgi:hypothetical protein
MKGKIAVVVLVLSVAAGYVSVQGWLARQPSLPTTFNLEEKGAPEPQKALPEPAPKPPAATTVSRLNISASRLREVTDDAAVEDLLRQTTEMAVGERRDLGGKRESLVLNGRVLFEGFQLGPARMSASGRVTVASLESELPALEDADLELHFKNGRLEASASAVWLIWDGKKERISLPDLHAQHPCISPDGTQIAYSGQTLDGRKLPGAFGLYVYDVPSRRTLTVRYKKQQRAIPLFWQEGTLAVFEGGMESQTNQVTFLKLVL